MAAMAAALIVLTGCAGSNGQSPSGGGQHVQQREAMPTTVASTSLPEVSWNPGNVPDQFTRKLANKKKCEKASAYLPLSRARSVTSASQLAALIEQSLGEDTTGNAKISGTNMTPNMYLHSVNAAKSRVSGVGALPTYLRSLMKHPMPQDRTFRMTRVIYLQKADCAERFVVDTTAGYARPAHPNEVAWIDPNDSSIVFAGDCTNSPLEVVTVQATTVTVLPPAQPAIADEMSQRYCVWARVRKNERFDLWLRLGSVTGKVLRKWDADDLAWESGDEPGWYAKVCMTEADLQKAEAERKDLVLCHKKADVRFRRDRDFSLLRGNPENPKSDPATLGTGY